MSRVKPKAVTDTSKPSKFPRDWYEEPHSGILWVGRWSSGDVEFTIRSSSDMGGGRGVMRFRLILLLQTTGYRTGEEGSKRMIRKWIRLSPFPLSHQPGKEIQRGNLRRENKQMEVSQNRNWQREKSKQRTCHLKKHKKSWETEMRVTTPLLIQMQTWDYSDMVDSYLVQTTSWKIENK